ncbi:P2X purinoceptor 7-like, partial [Theristicus caerulescens]
WSYRIAYPFTKAICSSDESCEKGSVDIHSHGIQTGRCVNYNATVKSCEVRAWCPIEYVEKTPEEVKEISAVPVVGHYQGPKIMDERPAVLRSSEDFTVLTKSNIHFPKFNYTTLNIPPNLNASCTYSKITSLLCLIFHLGDILQEAKKNFSEVAVKGGIIAIEINWDCNLDSWFYGCSPKYGFHCLDDKKIKPGFHFSLDCQVGCWAKYCSSGWPQHLHFKRLKGLEEGRRNYASFCVLQPHGIISPEEAAQIFIYSFADLQSTTSYHMGRSRELFSKSEIRFDILVFGTVNAIIFPCGGRRKLAISLAPLLPYTPLLSPVHHSGMEVTLDE